MHISRPSTGTILGGLALFIALGGTALAATGTIVNIADPTTASHIAHVDANGKLEVGDGTGALTVDGTVNTEAAGPSTWLHYFGFNNSTTCTVIATPPTGKAMVIRQVRVDVYQDPSPGISQLVSLYNDKTCSNIVADVNPPSIGQTVVPFDPGLGIPAGSGFSMLTNGSVAAEAFVDAYSVPSTVIPAAAAATTNKPPQQVRASKTR